MAAREITIIGKTPPPIGGVTRFNSDLIDLLTADGFLVKQCPVRLLSVGKCLLGPSTDVLVSLSNRYVIALLVFILKIRRFKVSVIIHGDIQRSHTLLANIVLLIHALCHHFIVLNESSYAFIGSSPKSKLIGTNLNPIAKQQRRIQSIEEATFLTYASNADLLNKQEIYGISFLYDFFKNSKLKLIVLDPSNCFSHLRETRKIKIYRKPVQIKHVIGAGSVYIRNTITDGDSLLIHEAMSLGAHVIATNVVTRPPGVLTFDYCNDKDLLRQIKCLPTHCALPSKTNRQDWLNFFHHIVPLEKAR